jgi:hypothetical protein
LFRLVNADKRNDNQELSNVRLDLREQSIESPTATERFDIIHLVQHLPTLRGGSVEHRGAMRVSARK